MNLIGLSFLVIEEDEPEREEVDAELLVHALRDGLRVRQLHRALQDMARWTLPYAVGL